MMSGNASAGGNVGDLPYANKSLGQHWLTDREALSAIADSAGLKPDDTVLEIGPGTGTLTGLLVRQAGQVVAVEFDKKLAKALPDRVRVDNLTVVQSDILQFDLTSLPPDYVVVANIPYYLTSNLIRTLSESVNPPRRAVLLIQKEVAERVAAGPGDMSLLSVSAQFYWQVSLGVVVGNQSFTPPPQVDSQVIILDKRAEPLFDVDAKRFFRIVKAGFSNRRKTLQNSLTGGLQLDKAATAEMLNQAGIKPSTRPQELSLSEWFNIYQIFN